MPDNFYKSPSADIHAQPVIKTEFHWTTRTGFALLSIASVTIFLALFTHLFHSDLEATVIMCVAASLVFALGMLFYYKGPKYDS